MQRNKQIVSMDTLIVSDKKDNPSQNTKKRKHKDIQFDAEIPIISKEVIKSIASYKRSVNKVQSVRDLFSLTDNNELPNEEHEFITLCNECITVLESILLNGFEDDDIELEEFSDNMFSLYELFNIYRIIRYKTISELALLNKTNRVSVSMICFLVECHILYIMDEFDISPIKSLDELQLKILIDYELSHFADKKIKDYTQNEIIITMTALCDSWNSITSKHQKEIWNILYQYLYSIQTRIARLIISHHDESILNGRDRIEKISVSKNLFSASIEFIANMACIMSHIQKSIEVRNSIQSICRNKRFRVIGTQHWSDSIYVPTIRIGFRNWIHRTLKTLQAAKFRDKMKAVVYRYAIRMHEPEMYSRNNGGIKNKNALSIIERIRTPLQNAFFNLELLPPDMTTLLPNTKYVHEKSHKHDLEDDEYEYEEEENITFTSEYQHMGSIITSLVFSYHCESDMLFDWISNNFLDDHDYYEFQSTLEWRKEPTVIRIAGEYNVWYNQKLWMTYDIDLAILYWIVIMTTKFKSKYEFNDKVYNLKNIIDLMTMWKKDGKSIMQSNEKKPTLASKTNITLSHKKESKEEEENDSDDDNDVTMIDLAMF
jgi:hypothetical protein